MIDLRRFGFVALLAASTALTGCLDDDDGSPKPVVEEVASDSPLTISGSPPSSTTVGKRYQFQPVANDPNGEPIVYEIQNRPRWSSFDAKTGRLRGTPTDSDVGAYSGIVIAASDGTRRAALGPFTITVRKTEAGPADGAPSIAGIPATGIETGRNYTFQPSASDPNGDALTFRIANKPSWASFDASSGRLTGRPGEADVGSYAGIQVSVSDGSATATLPDFSITVRKAGTAVSGGQFTFADPPEITFIRGYSEQQNLGIWHIDPANRWEPGDLDNGGGWQPRVATQIEILEGTLNGVRYDSGTAVLSYDGNAGAGWARVRLVAPSVAATSREFYVRVLNPDVIWGKDATARVELATRFPGVPRFDYGKTSYADAWQAVAPSTSGDDPDVMLVLGGSYTATVEANLTGQVDAATGALDNKVQWSARTGKGERPWFYLVGEPGDRPKFSAMDARNGGSLQVPGYRVSVVRNVEIEAIVTATGGGGWQVGTPNRKYWSRIYAHHTNGLQRAQWPDVRSINDDVFGSDSPEGDTTDSYVRRGVPVAPNDWRSWFWENRFYRTGGSSLKHTIYLHGRPDGWLIYNNNLHNGGHESSAVKATVGHYRVLNSRISAFADEGRPDDMTDKLAQQLIDVPSSSDVVIFNNHLIGGRRSLGGDTDGTRTGLIWFNPRRTLWGTDDPRYPDVSFQAAPFGNVRLPFRSAGVAGPDAGAVAEIRSAGGGWQELANKPTFDANGTGGGSNWVALLRPDELPRNGKYEVRIRGTQETSDTFITLTVARNANYFAVTSFADGGLSTPWYADGPRAYLPDEGRAYWQAMRDWGGSGGDGRAEPDNPYTSKKFVAYNRFTWLLHPALDTKREEAIRDNGSYPSSAVYIGSAASYYGAVPENWLDAGVTFLANNSYEGWRPEDMGTDAWLRSELSAISTNPQNLLYGPAQADPQKRLWPNYSSDMPADRAPLFVEVGGEQTPVALDAAPVALPAWFRLF